MFQQKQRGRSGHIASSHNTTLKRRARYSMGIGGALGAVLLTVITIAPANASAGAADDDALSTSINAPLAAARNAAGDSLDPAGFWTEEKLQSAIPLDLLPDTTGSDRRSEPPAESDESSDEGVTLSDPVAPLQSSEITPFADPVASTVGRLFFNTPNGPSSCTASTINNANKNLLITAGHCVHQGGGGAWYSNFLFAPSYYDGPSAQGYWSWSNARTFNSWMDSSDFTHDQAFIAVYPNNGTQIVDAVGGNGLVTGAGPVQSNVRVWGYPADPPFTGEIPYYCDGNTTAVAFSSDASFPCGMNGGASGGPWLKDRINVNLGYTWAITSRCETTPGTTDCALTNLRSTPNTRDVVTMFNLM
ncbi:hypothetical protein E3O25_02660 [Cryobacterium sp. TMT1-3]|uniref:trypsin-like serine peptidase n=1 Tax=Cryobacterium sp. TMT1-3 TaxID=1259237 RepID=UPI00106AFA98|nr:hypothetical protein [Cryobacterium sp. TMT1-3]TFC31365.1 hypothetical protein E3O25_02660 [Cryobacterium sp. TMT1-3]